MKDRPILESDFVSARELKLIQEIVSLAERLSEVHAWAVCAAITGPDDLFENIERIIEITKPNLTETP